MGEQAEWMMEVVIWDIFESLDEVPQPKRYRKTKRIVPRKLQKFGNKEFEKATGIRRRWWGLFS